MACATGRRCRDGFVLGIPEVLCFLDLGMCRFGCEGWSQRHFEFNGFFCDEAVFTKWTLFSIVLLLPFDMRCWLYVRKSSCGTFAESRGVKGLLIADLSQLADGYLTFDRENAMVRKKVQILPLRS